MPVLGDEIWENWGILQHGPAASNGDDDDCSHWCDDPHDPDDGDFEQIWAALENILFLFTRQHTISVHDMIPIENWKGQI